MDEPSTPPPGRERGPNEVFCRDCGESISARAEICPACGVRQRPPPSSLDAALAGGNPFVAAALSAILPGLGQLYNRELERGLAFVAAGVLAGLSTVVLVGVVLYPVVWLYAIYDAYTRAEGRGAARATDDASSRG